jgi:hypothetical protein
VHLDAQHSIAVAVLIEDIQGPQEASTATQIGVRALQAALQADL